MQKVYSDNVRVPIKSWCKEPEEGAIKQAMDCANLPFVYKWVSLMPDTHFGYGVPIGCVLPTTDVIIPNAVGVDIGCGMAAIPLGIDKNNTDYDFNALFKTLAPIFTQIKRSEYFQPNFLLNETKCCLAQLTAQPEYQIGTLGGGNHFFELQYDENDQLWFMVHSGSRGFGAYIANHYHKLAQEKIKQWFVNCPKDLAFLPMDYYGSDYYQDMQQAVNYAKYSRQVMITEALRTIKLEIDSSKYIDIEHNYAAVENHFGKNVIVHRKGATLAREGVIGIIPGSMTTKSYIVRGKGCADSFNSCSHGSGRLFSRTQAIKRVKDGTDHSQDKQLKEANVELYGHRNVKDELGSAYKCVENVMSEQTDLVDILHTLIPLRVLKGK